MILTLANIITRLLGFFYRIFMSNILGSEGMGLYQLISPVYMLVWAFSSAGLSTSISKLTAEQKATKSYGNMRRIVLMASGVSVLLAGIASIIIFAFSSQICICLFKDERTILSMRILALCFPFMAAGSCLRGWFYGMQEVAVPAQCQVLEQCTRMAVVYILSLYISGKGLEITCAAAVTGMAVGEVTSCIYVVLRAMSEKHKGTRKSLTLSRRKAGMMILATALPLTLNRVSCALLSTAENVLLPDRLELYGYTRSAALSLYGQLCAMAMPLIMFPSSLLTALSSALMPAVSEAKAGGSTSDMASAVEKSLTFTAIVGIGTAGLFLTLPYELGKVIYNQPELGSLLRPLGIICPFIYMQVTLSGVLNGLGKQLYIFTVNLISSLFNICVIYALVPIYGIKAFLLGWFLSTVVTTILSFGITACCIRLKLYINNILLKPIAAAAIACITLRIYTLQKAIALTSVASLVCAVLFIGGIYLILILLSKAVSLKS
jgi:stage V sporulation protein B